MAGVNPEPVGSCVVALEISNVQVRTVAVQVGAPPRSIAA